MLQIPNPLPLFHPRKKILLAYCRILLAISWFAQINLISILRRKEDPQGLARQHTIFPALSPTSTVLPFISCYFCIMLATMT
jgi:hypothetical protein